MNVRTAQIGRRGSFLSDDNLRDEGSFDIRRIKIARPGLVVVAGFIYFSGVYDFFESRNIKTQSISVDWSEKSLLKVSEGKLDFCIYNTVGFNEFQQKNQNLKMHNLGEIGASMGGRYFSITTSKENKLIGMGLEEIKKNLNGVKIYVGENTDRFENLKLVFGMSKEDFINSGALIINRAEPDLDILDYEKDSLLICGQNLRVAAKLNEKYTEIISFDDLSPECQEILLSHSRNSLIVSRSLFEYLVKNNINLLEQLRRYQSEIIGDKERYNEIEQTILEQCFDYDMQEKYDCLKIARYILFETYRFGKPVFVNEV